MVVLAAASILLLLITLPMLAIAIRAAPSFAQALGQEDVGITLRLTALTSLTAVVIIVLLGTPLALLLARRQIKAWRIIDALVDVPVVLPPSVAGIGLLMVFGRRGLLGPLLSDLGMELAFTTAAVIIAQVFRHVTLPLAAPAILSGAALAWARTLGEFGATILFAGNLVGRTQTMSLAIYVNFQSDLDIALALSFLLVLVSFAVLVIVRLLPREET